MQTQVDLMDSMEISVEDRTVQSSDPAIACAVVCCCAVATVCLVGCLLAAPELV